MISLPRQSLFIYFWGRGGAQQLNNQWFMKELFTLLKLLFTAYITMLFRMFISETTITLCQNLGHTLINTDNNN